MPRDSHALSLARDQVFIDELVGRTRQAALDPSDAESIRGAFAGVLGKIEIDPAEIAHWRDGTDIVGGAYARLLTGEQRRATGQFFTPFWAGELMAGWLFDKPRRLVLDPGVGSGALLITAARHPKRRTARLLGVDVDPLAIEMLRTNAWTRGIKDIVGVESNFLLVFPTSAATSVSDEDVQGKVDVGVDRASE